MSAIRDMSQKQFNAALERNGFRALPWGIHFEDTTGVSTTCWGAIINHDYSINRRATLAMLMQKRDEAKKAKAQRAEVAA